MHWPKRYWSDCQKSYDKTEGSKSEVRHRIKSVRKQLKIQQPLLPMQNCKRTPISGSTIHISCKGALEHHGLAVCISTTLAGNRNNVGKFILLLKIFITPGKNIFSGWHWRLSMWRAVQMDESQLLLLFIVCIFTADWTSEHVPVQCEHQSWSYRVQINL